MKTGLNYGTEISSTGGNGDNGGPKVRMTKLPGGLAPRSISPVSSLCGLRYLLFNPLRVAVLAGALVLGLAAGTATAQTYSVLHSFGVLTNLTGHAPDSLVQGPDGTLYGAGLGEFNVGGVVFKIQPDGTGFTVLKYFPKSAGESLPRLTLAGSTLYGATPYGGSSDKGTVFKLNTDGSGFTVLKDFTGSDGRVPNGVVLASAGTTLYGITSVGGSSDKGTVFKLNTDGGGFTVLKHCTTSDGWNPSGLVLASSGTTLYGATGWGGSSNAGTVFRLNTDGTGFTVLKHFTGVECHPGSLLLSGTTLYGVTAVSVGYNAGMVFKLNTDGSGFSVLKSYPFPSADGVPWGLVLSGATLYGTTRGVSTMSTYGTLFKMNTDGTGYSVLKYFTSDQEASTLQVLSGATFYGTSRSGGAFRAGTVFRVNTDGSGWVDLQTFSYTGDGLKPQAGLLLSGPTLYGTTYYGGSSGAGTIFQVNTDGAGYEVLKHFIGDDGREPHGMLIQSGTTLYGTTYSGGSSRKGTVFKLGADGSEFTVLKYFAGSDGERPWAGLVLSGATLYGVTEHGGTSNSGTIFKLNTDGGDFAVLKHFTGSDGSRPDGRLLLSGTTLYGTTAYGGSSNVGTVFKLNTDGGGFTVLKHFSGSSGEIPCAGLVLSGTTLYGTTEYGGFYEDAGTVFKLNTNGSGFAVLYRFADSDGAYPEGDLVLSGTTLYGTTAAGGSFNYGTVFKINTDGSDFAVLKEFAGGSEGKTLRADLALAGTTLYGTTESGGDLDAGVVFSLALAPPVVLAPTHLPSGACQLCFPGFPGHNYVILYASSLDGPWNTLTNIIAPANGVVEYEDTTLPAPPRRFYRVSY